MCRVKIEMIYIMSSAASFRVEKDLLGTLEVPADAYYGIQTLRAANNFHLSGVPLSHYPKLVVAPPWSSRLLPTPTVSWVT